MLWTSTRCPEEANGAPEKRTLRGEHNHWDIRASAVLNIKYYYSLVNVDKGLLLLGHRYSTTVDTLCV
jgi:hypothetical protein